MVRREKAVYDTLNMLNFDVTKKCLVGEGRCPILCKNSERIEESSERLRSGLTRWVDGNEVDSETTPWSMIDESESGEAYGSFRRVKKARRVDSFDVEAMEIACSHGHHSKVMLKALIICGFMDLCNGLWNLQHSPKKNVNSPRV